MICLYKKNGFYAYIFHIARGSLIGPLIAVPMLILFELGSYSRSDVFFNFGIFYIITFSSILIINAIEFWGRKDDYVFRSDFLVVVYNLRLEEVVKVLISQGYGVDQLESRDTSRVFIKEITFATGIGSQISEVRRWSVKLSKRKDTISVYFFLPGVDFFDGRQIAYRAALDFVSNLDINVKREFGILEEKS